MSRNRFFAVTRLNGLLQLRDCGPLILMSIIPFVLIPFLMPAEKAVLIAQGYPNATGAEQAVPGMAVLFSFPSVQIIIQSFFHESQWHTWERLRASAASNRDMILGRVVISCLAQSIQICFVLVLASLLYGFRKMGSVVALVCVILAFSAVLTALGVALGLWVQSEGTAFSLSNLIGMPAAGVGGAFCAVSTFPEWSQPLAKLSPAYWALDAVNEISLRGAQLSSVVPQIGMLALFCAAYLHRDQIRDLYDVTFIANTYLLQLRGDAREALKRAFREKGVEQVRYLARGEPDRLVGSVEELEHRFLQAQQRLRQPTAPGAHDLKDTLRPELEALQPYDEPEAEPSGRHPGPNPQAIGTPGPVTRLGPAAI